jgi:hypothetical protein
MSEKEKSLKRHELCCLRFSDGTASDRDTKTLKRKGIDPQPWIKLQDLLHAHFTTIQSPDLSDSICSKLGIGKIPIGNSLGLSEEELSTISVLDIVSKRLELDFEEAPDVPPIVSNDINSDLGIEDSPVIEKVYKDPLDELIQGLEDVNSHSVETVQEEVIDSSNQEEINQEEINQEEINEGFIDSLILENIDAEEESVSQIGKGPNQEEIGQEEINQEEINQEEINQEEINQEEINQEEINQEEINQEEIKIEEIKIEDNLSGTGFVVEEISEEINLQMNPPNDQRTKDVVQHESNKIVLDGDEIEELTELENMFSIGRFLIDNSSNIDFTSSIMSQVNEEFRKLVGSYDRNENSLEQLIEDTYKSMTNPPPKSVTPQEPIKPLFDDILQEVNFGNTTEFMEKEIKENEQNTEDMNRENSDVDEPIDFSMYHRESSRTENIAQDSAINQDDVQDESNIGFESNVLSEVLDSENEYDSEESEEFMLSLDSAIQIEAIEEREIRDVEAIFEGSRIDLGTALRDPNPPSHSEMIRAIMEQVTRFGSIQHELKLVTEEVENEEDETKIVSSYEEDFAGDVVVSITDIRPPVTVNINSKSGNKTMLALSGLIAVAAVLLLYFFASVPNGQEGPVIGGFELAETDVEILDIDSDEDFSIMKRDGKPTIIFIHEE